MVSSIRDSSYKGFRTAGRRGVESSPSLRMFETIAIAIQGAPAARLWCADGKNQRSGERSADRVRFDSAVHVSPRGARVISISPRADVLARRACRR